MKRLIDYATSQQGTLTIVLTMMVLGSVLALLNDAPFVEHQDAIGLADG